MSVLTTLIDGHYALKDSAGKEYRVAAIITEHMEAEFARWNYQRAVQGLLDSRDLYTDEEFRAERERLVKARNDGHFDLISKGGSEALATKPGVQFLLSLLIPDCQGSQVLTVLAGLPEGELKELINTILRDSFPGMMRPVSPDPADAKKK
jgi:hypothetical protein